MSRQLKAERNLELVLKRRLGWSFSRLANFYNIDVRAAFETYYRWKDRIDELEKLSPYNKKKQLKIKIASSLSGLSQRERDILQLRFGLVGGKVCSLAEIGKKYGITKERVRQIIKKTLEKIEG